MMTPDPITPPCHADDDRMSAAVREADAMLGMWAELFRQYRTINGVEGALERMHYVLSDLPDAEVRGLLYAALIRLTEPAPKLGNAAATLSKQEIIDRLAVIGAAGPADIEHMTRTELLDSYGHLL